jgi:D-3-phosphoglycerate dehydrogenase
VNVTRSSPTKRPNLLIAESHDFSSQALKILNATFEVQVADCDRNDLLRRVKDVDVLWVRLRNMIDAEIMDAAPKLRAIVTNTTGLTHVDMDQAEQRGIQIISLRGEVDFLKDVRATAEHTIALTLSLLRKLPAAHKHVIDGGWDRYQFKGQELYGKTIGIIGYGRLGRITAQYFRAFGANLLVTDSKRHSAIDGIEFVDKNRLLDRADLISLHTNYVPANHNMISSAEFNLMRSGTTFINTARGELVDEQALLAALESGHLGGAAIDVLANEHCRTQEAQALIDYARRHDNLILSPHVGGYTHESLDKTELFLTHKLVQTFDVAEGKRN